MANWVLSIDLRATGGDLARALRQAATAARTLGRDSQHTRRDLTQLGASGRRVRTLGDDSRRASRHVRMLGQDARTAARLTQQAGLRSQTAGRHVRTLGTNAGRASNHLRTLGTHSRTAARNQQAAGRAAARTTQDFRALSRQMRAATRDMQRLATASTNAARRTRTAGDHGARSMGRFASAASRARSQVAGLTTLLAGGGLILGGAEIIKEGNEYQKQMNMFRAVTSANAAQMQNAAAVARQLGNDLSLPASTAADAAEAMVDLAKAGFRADQAIASSRAALQLSTGMHVKAADAAMYLGDAMDQFGLGADQAGRAADTLAATATSASGGIRDIWYAMKYAGPVANSLSVSMQDTAAAIVGLGKAGIIGQTAGTTLRGALSNLAAPTDQMKSGLKTLGIEAFDASGRFKGLATVIDGLHKAQHELTQQEFVGAVKKAFGKPAMSGMIALGHQGVEAFEAAQLTVSQYGKAAQIAGSQSKGLTGAMTQLKTQARQSGLAIYEGLSPGLEFLTRGLTKGLATATPHITDFIHYGNDLAVLFGPELAAKARSGLGEFADQASHLIGPLREVGEEAAADALHILVNAARAGVDVLENLMDAVEPIGDGLSDLANGSNGAATALDIIVTVADLALSGLSAFSNILGPVGAGVGALVHLFAALPGPVQTAVAAMLLTRRVGPALAGTAGAIGGRFTAASGSVRAFNQQMAVQRALAASAGVSLTRYGAAVAVLQARVPVIGQMGTAFRGATAAGTGFVTTLRGMGAAAGTGLLAAGRGLVSFLGGPWGVALTGATIALGFLASSQAKASEQAAAHRANMEGLTQALRDSNGQINESVRAAAAKAVADKKLERGGASLLEIMKQAGYSLSDVTDAYLGQGTSIDELARRMHKLAAAEKAAADAVPKGKLDPENHFGKATYFEDAADALEGMSGEAKKAAGDARDMNEAMRGTGAGVSAYDRLKTAVSALADKTGDADTRTRALKDALDLLSGGSISLQAAQARVNNAILQMNESLSDGVDKTAGWGKALLNANGSLNTTTRNGQQLYQQLTDLTDAAAGAAVSAFKFADETGKSLPLSLKAASREMQTSRDAAIKTAEAYGFSRKQAEAVADSMGLIPGKVSLLLQTEGVDSTLADLLAVQAEFTRLPKAKTVKVDTLSEQAQKELRELGYKVKTVPGTREIKITAPSGGARRDLDGLISKLAQVPGEKKVRVGAETRRAIADLQAVQAKVRSTNGKTITMRAPTAAARAELERLGFKIKNTRGKNVVITVPTGGPKASVAAIQGAINGLHGKTVTNYVTTVHRNSFYKKPLFKEADGGVVDSYANGGIRQRGGVRRFADGAEQHIAQIAPAGTWRVWAEPETGGEAYIPLSPWKRGRSRRIAEETVRRLGGKGIAWKADGGLVQQFDVGGFTYTPSGLRRTASDVQSRYAEAHQPISKADYNKALRARANAVDNLRAAEARLRYVRRHKHTHAQLVAAETRVAKARRSVATATDKARSAESRYRKKFSLSDWQRTLKSAVKANASWEANLKKIEARGGGSVVGILRDMGEEGAAMVATLAKASKKQFADIVANLKKLAPEAKATLADYTKQLTASTKTDKAFQGNLAKLAAMGYGDLAAQLAAQGDEAAQRVAAEAVKDTKKAAAANTAAKSAAQTLTDDQVTELVQIIAAIKTKDTGIHAVAGATGLAEDEIITVAGKATSQITSALGTRAARFLSDLQKAKAHQAYADGGIRPGLYAARHPYGMVRWAEPETGGEAYIPLGANKRRSATSVLGEVAGRFGYGLTDVASARSRVVVVQQGGPLVGSQTWNVSGGGNAVDTAREIESRDSYQLRRLARGGVHR